MNFDKKLFINLLEELVLIGNIQFDRNNQSAHYYFDNEKDLFILCVQTGRDVGGDCWGGIASYEKCDQIKPEFDLIEDLFVYFNSEFPLRCYRDFKKLTHTYETSRSEYYGNGTYQDRTEVSTIDLLEVMKNGGITLNNQRLNNAIIHFKNKKHDYTRRPSR